MKHLLVISLIAFLISLGLYTLETEAQSDKACWGQATAVFAKMGEMGKHASQEPTPRLGLKNLANALHEQGVLDEPTMQALGAFVAAELGLSIKACM